VTAQAIRDAMQLRHALIPYLYAMAWRNHTRAVPLITPLYYDYPDDDDAYRCRNQYTFGSELMAAPFTSPINPDTRLSRQTVWLPRADWFNFFDGEHFPGGQWYSIYGQLDDIPVFARAGAIVPLAPKPPWGGVGNPARLDLVIFPGAGNRFELYEDDGETTAYRQGQSALTAFNQTWRDDQLDFTIDPAAGDISMLPARRNYCLIFRGISQPDRVEVRLNGLAQPVTAAYDAVTESFRIDDLSVTPADRVEVLIGVNAGALMARRDRRLETCRAMLRTFKMESDLKAAIDEDLARILKDSHRLHSYGAGVTDAQLAALLSVIQTREK
jgi:hypothetical protein